MLIRHRGHPGTAACLLLSYPVIASFSLHIFHLPLQTFSFHFYEVASHRDHTEISLARWQHSFLPKLEGNGPGTFWPPCISPAVHGARGGVGTTPAWGWRADTPIPLPPTCWMGTLPSELLPSCKVREKMKMGSPRQKKVELPAVHIFRHFISQFPAWCNL